MGDVLQPKNSPDATALNQAIREYDIPFRVDKDGVKVPLSPVYMVDLATGLASAFNNWESFPTKVLVGNDPAAGADPAAWTVPAGKRWQIIAAMYELVTAVAAANRYVGIKHYYSGGNKELYYASRAQVASQDMTWTFGNAPPGGLVQATGFANETMPPLYCEPGDTIKFTVLNLQGADDGSTPTILYREAPA